MPKSEKMAFADRVRAVEMGPGQKGAALKFTIIVRHVDWRRNDSERIGFCNLCLSMVNQMDLENKTRRLRQRENGVEMASYFHI